MASSKYWNNLYKDKKSEAKNYNDRLNEIIKIRGTLEDFRSEIRNVNDEIDDLQEDLRKAVRHNYRFEANTNNLVAEKEKATTADPNLKNSMNELDDEITRLGTLKTNAERDRDQYYQNYKAAKDQERQDIIDGIVDFFT